MIAALPMYDRPETAAANDAFWTAIRARLGHGPSRLTRPDDPWPVWRSPDLLLAQTCGLPFRATLHTTVTLVGTPDYSLPGCPPGHYRSVLVARKPAAPLTDLLAGPFAYNEALSQSGWAAPQAFFVEAGLPGPQTLLKTGAHRASARAVAEGRASLAALDALSWELMRQHDRFTDVLEVVAATRPTPGLPLITAARRDAKALYTAVTAAITDLSPADRATLHLRGLVAIPAADYLAVPLPIPPN
ncbi:phosphate/phosphite/phosphonate ABC transporter substrate-binding protein [Marimonas arenosa]|uniref:Phosphate/phosphite/phosphonate ABC transporter substrate-binding protein n=1 Tax=Marimonas arenosa TaxID=1795305 RepID=A0AAE4B491_9RHOB|nr:PhnD/SsuA/transferrin family substrate-binding protein [Marimonas arenosa]MDQ2089164.1 phosphate/phosphite/phosphonate ABC transporter substrate-binding protein [Marimonas arenosa]